MKDYVIVTDSSCDLPEGLVNQLGVVVVPLSIQFGTERFRNCPGEGPDSHEFYQRLFQGEPAQTSAPNVEDFKSRIRPHLALGRDVLYLGFSSALSATYQNGAIALDELKEDFPQATLLAVDTLCASLGQGLLVDLAVAQKRAGKSIQEVKDYVEQTKLHLCHWFTVGNLTQLRRGGRLSAGKAVLGSLLHVKPILHVDDEGRLVPVDTVKGRKNSIQAMVDRMAESIRSPEGQHIYISHGDCPQDAQVLADLVKAKFPSVTVTIGDVGPVIGAHSGLGTLALFFLGEHR
jgi:DegV family protein with EDD domain